MKACRQTHFRRSAVRYYADAGDFHIGSEAIPWTRVEKSEDGVQVPGRRAARFDAKNLPAGMCVRPRYSRKNLYEDDDAC